MSAAKATQLFVYGTLKPGCSNYRRIAHLVRSARPAFTSGILLDLGPYPALVPGHGRVKGVLLGVDDGALAITDRIEGYQSEGVNNLYIRKSASVWLDDGGEITAWVYEYAHSDGIAVCPEVALGVEDGVPVYEWPSPSGTPPGS